MTVALPEGGNNRANKEVDKPRMYSEVALTGLDVELDVEMQKEQMSQA